MADDKPTCSGCRWWQFQRAPDDGDEGSRDAIGYCRRYPPERRENGVGAWPITIAYDWCGEFDEITAPASDTSRQTH